MLGKKSAAAAAGASAAEAKIEIFATAPDDAVPTFLTPSLQPPVPKDSLGFKFRRYDTGNIVPRTSTEEPTPLSMNTPATAGLAVPTEAPSLKHASSGVRRALKIEESERKPLNLTTSSDSEYQCRLIGGVLCPQYDGRRGFQASERLQE